MHTPASIDKQILRVARDLWRAAATKRNFTQAGSWKRVLTRVVPLLFRRFDRLGRRGRADRFAYNLITRHRLTFLGFRALQ
jgi:hypothetical protein